MRKVIYKFFLFYFLLFILECNSTCADTKESWQDLSGEHFIVYFTGEDGFAREILNKAEVYYQRIATDLGYPRYSEFWLWDKRVKIYLYPNRDSFLSSTGQPTWSHGMADYNKKIIASYAGSNEFLCSILPHEMAHLIFRDFVGFKGEIPLWLDEGVAQWEEEPKRKQIKHMAKQFLDRDGLLSLEDMMRLDIRNIRYKENIYIRPTRTKDGKEGILFLSADMLIDTYYLQSASLVGFLIERYGSDNFAHFCRQLRDGKTFKEALLSVYSTYIKSMAEFEERWIDYVDKGGQ
ncbi:MAG: hypothetical protein NC908_01635 [Candidatus Omnitrophica bacterium]|nr:hypothetical protein [Candidatus Omnitrophota bacterium]